MRRLTFTTLSLLFVMEGATQLLSLRERVFVNVSQSAKRGIYGCTRGDVGKGSLALVDLPARIASTLPQYSWFRSEWPLLKEIRALAGESVCIDGDRGLTVAGESLGPIYRSDPDGKALPINEGCYTVPEGYFFALGQSDTSFDSRYFGPLPLSSIRCVAKPLLTF